MTQAVPAVLERPVQRKRNAAVLRQLMEVLNDLNPTGQVSDDELVACVQLHSLAVEDGDLFQELQPPDYKERVLQKLVDARAAFGRHRERGHRLMQNAGLSINPELYQ